MILPELLYQPSDVDYQQLQAQIETARVAVTGFQVVHTGDVFRVPRDRAFIVQAASMVATPGASQRVVVGWIICWLSGVFGVGPSFPILVLGPSSVNFVSVAMLPSTLILPAGSLIRYSVTYDQSTNQNQIEVDLCGWTIPRGRLAF